MKSYTQRREVPGLSPMKPADSKMYNYMCCFTTCFLSFFLPTKHFFIMARHHRRSNKQTVSPIGICMFKRYEFWYIGLPASALISKDRTTRFQGDIGMRNAMKPVITWIACTYAANISWNSWFYLRSRCRPNSLLFKRIRARFVDHSTFLYWLHVVP